MALINRQTFSALLPGGAIVQPIAGNITMDELWSPFIQASITIPAPASLSLLDPRATPPPRVTLTAQQDFTDSDELSVFTTLYGGGTVAALTTLYGGGTVAAITAAHNRPWVNDQYARRIIRTFDLGLRARARDVENTVRLSLASDEALLQDIAPISGPGGDSGLPGVGGGVLNATTFAEAIPAILDAALDAPVITESTVTGDISSFVETWGIPGTPPQGIAWTAGQSAWDFANMLVQAIGGRLWCDEARLWHLTAPGINQPVAIAIEAGESLVNYTDEISRDADWYDAVVVTYTWTNAAGANFFTTDYAPTDLSAYSRTYAVTRDLGKRKSGFSPPVGAAAALLAQVSNLGRILPLESVNDFNTIPGAALTVILPDATTLTGRVASVAFDMQSKEMSISTRNMS